MSSARADGGPAASSDASADRDGVVTGGSGGSGGGKRSESVEGSSAPGSEALDLASTAAIDASVASALAGEADDDARAAARAKLMAREGDSGASPDAETMAAQLRAMSAEMDTAVSGVAEWRAQHERDLTERMRKLRASEEPDDVRDDAAGSGGGDSDSDLDDDPELQRLRKMRAEAEARLEASKAGGAADERTGDSLNSELRRLRAEAHAPVDRAAMAKLTSATESAEHSEALSKAKVDVVALRIEAELRAKLMADGVLDSDDLTSMETDMAGANQLGGGLSDYSRDLDAILGRIETVDSELASERAKHEGASKVKGVGTGDDADDAGAGAGGGRGTGRGTVEAKPDDDDA